MKACALLLLFCILLSTATYPFVECAFAANSETKGNIDMRLWSQSVINHFQDSISDAPNIIDLDLGGGRKLPVSVYAGVDMIFPPNMGVVDCNLDLDIPQNVIIPTGTQLDCDGTFHCERSFATAERCYFDKKCTVDGDLLISDIAEFNGDLSVGHSLWCNAECKCDASVNSRAIWGTGTLSVDGDLNVDDSYSTYGYLVVLGDFKCHSAMTAMLFVRGSLTTDGLIYTTNGDIHAGQLTTSGSALVAGRNIRVLGTLVARSPLTIKVGVDPFTDVSHPGIYCTSISGPVTILSGILRLQQNENVGGY